MQRMGVVLCLVLLCGPAKAWGPGTHAYIAMRALGTTDGDMLFGAMMPDFNALFRNWPAEMNAMQHMTHFEYGLAPRSFFTTGFTTHNGAWGADYFAHLYYDAGAPDIYSTIKIREISAEFGLSMIRAEDIFEMSVEYLLRMDYGPRLGTLIAQSSSSAGQNAAGWAAAAFAAPLAARVPGLTRETAELHIRGAAESFRNLTAYYGQGLAGEDAFVRSTLVALLAGYLGSDAATAEAYLDRATEICGDYRPEIDRVAEAVRASLDANPEYQVPMSNAALLILIAAIAGLGSALSIRGYRHPRT